jgi:hypothetical protein
MRLGWRQIDQRGSKLMHLDKCMPGMLRYLKILFLVRSSDALKWSFLTWQRNLLLWPFCGDMHCELAHTWRIALTLKLIKVMYYIPPCIALHLMIRCMAVPSVRKLFVALRIVYSFRSWYEKNKYQASKCNYYLFRQPFLGLKLLYRRWTESGLEICLPSRCGFVDPACACFLEFFYAGSD